MDAPLSCFTDFLMTLLSLTLGLFTLPTVETINEFYLLTIRHTDERSTIAELHRSGLGIIERRPVRQSPGCGAFHRSSPTGGAA